MKKATKVGGLGVAALATCLLGVQTAEASAQIWQCSVGGFTGYAQAYYFNNANGTKTVTDILYRINKGTNAGGNHANVHWSDGGTIPTTQFDSGDAGIQDNNWHFLWSSGCGCTGYNRGGGSAGMNFIFDKSNAPDPSCTAPANPWP